MQLSLLIVSCLVALVSAAPESPTPSLKDPSLLNDKPELYSTQDTDQLFNSVKEIYGKHYGSTQVEQRRRDIFKTNLKEIIASNQLYAQGLRTFTMGINQFSDMEPSEVVKYRTGYLPSTVSEALNETDFYLPDINDSPPLEVDWRDEGYVTPVKNQGKCGSCWSFSALGALEGQHFKKTGILVDLSEQQLVDCSRDFRNQGCTGGLPSYAFNYIASNGGVVKDESYSYSAREQTPCKYDPDMVEATCTGYKAVPQNELALMSAVANIGPISIAIDASLLTFQSYKSGVYDDVACSSKINHAVIVVGYGTSAPGQDYWIIKNSWGERWGMKGYAYMSRNKDNQCGIATVATFPVV